MFPGTDDEQQTLLRRSLDRLPGSALQLIEALSFPHWFNEPVLRRLIVELKIDKNLTSVIAASDGWGLIERWNDGSMAVIAPVRELLLNSAAAFSSDQYRTRSLLFADTFEALALDGGDVFDHAESVYHRLAAEPERGARLMLADGITWKSEPLFAFDALKRIVHGAREQKKRGMLSKRAERYSRLLALYLPDARNSARVEEQVLRRLLENVADDDLYEAELRLRLGLALLSLGSTAEAIDYFQEAGVLFDKTGSLRGRADAARSLGRAALREDRLDAAQELFERAREIFASLGLSASCAHCNKALGETAFYRGDCSNAEVGFLHALDGFIATRGHLGEANTRVVYSQLLSARAMLFEAHEQLDLASRTYLSIGHHLGSANCLKNRAVALFEGQRYDEALRVLDEALSLYSDWGSVSGRANCFLWMAACQTQLGHPESAMSLLDDAEHLFEQIGERYGRASAAREKGIALLALGQQLDAFKPLELAREEFVSVGNVVEATAAGVALGRAAAAADFPYPLTREAVHRLASDAEGTFKALGFARYRREAEDLIRRTSSKSKFAQTLSDALERTEYRRCETDEDLQDIYRLRYKAYIRAGMAEANSSQVICDSFDEAPNCYRFGVYFDGDLISTLRIHDVNKMEPYAPDVAVCGDLLLPRLENGANFISSSRFAADYEHPSILPLAPFITMRLAVIAAHHFDATFMTFATKADSTDFYKRIFRGNILANNVLYPDIKAHVELMSVDTEGRFLSNLYEEFPFFSSTPVERRMLFARRQFENLEPLTILPTAKYASIQGKIPVPFTGSESATIFFEDASPGNQEALVLLLRRLMQRQGYSETLAGEVSTEFRPMLASA